MDNAVMQSQGNLLRDVNYFQQRWSHARKAKGDKMKNLITYLKIMNVEDKMNTRFDMLARDGSQGHVHIINYFTKYRNEIFQYAIIKSDAKPSSIEELTISHLHSYLGMRGYIKGIGAMSAEERMAARKKGYEKKGDKMGITWERKYTEFESYNGMPEIGTKLFNWQYYQLGNGPASLNAKIRKEIEEKKGSTVWSDWRVKLFDCVEQKNRTKRGNAWERKYAEFESYNGMPKRGTPLHNWQRNQFKNGTGGLNAKIRKEKAENEDGTVWSEHRVKLANCFAQKRRE
jgi:hypothetical protein